MENYAAMRWKTCPYTDEDFSLHESQLFTDITKTKSNMFPIGTRVVNFYLLMDRWINLVPATATDYTLVFAKRLTDNRVARRWKHL